MNFDKPQAGEISKKEQFENPREKLKMLEKSGKFVFHGSPDIIEILEPRQAYNSNKEAGLEEKDGDPAVFATPYADVAIFRALVNAKDVIGESESSFGVNGENLHFSATENLLSQASKKVGKVYVLDKQKFNAFEGMQCRSAESITPTEVIEVTVKDLPENINPISSEKNENLAYNRMPITVEINGHLENIWTKYRLGSEVIIADCTKCGKESQELAIQKPEDIKVETSDPEIKNVVIEKLKQLVRTIEERMSVCNGCYDEEFLNKRAELYIVTLEQVQKEMGMNVDFEEQRRKIMGK